ncbi:hypothetical protein [Salinactinospora qingdaonensis]|uniref:hypothetical protein n=1 Tax=Salinactinospora qingdaonensis TaxID=702744 RepID=UPI0031EF4ECA
MLDVLVCCFAAAMLVVGAETATAFGPLALVPAAVAAALVNLYRGTLPAHLWIGYDTPLGNSAVLQIVIWHTAGLFALLVLAWPVVTAALILLPLWMQAVWLLVGSTLLACWGGWRARNALAMER